MMEAVVTRFPQVLFENCFGGGDYMPQVWSSDNTEAVCRFGRSEPSGGADNPAQNAGDVAMSGNFGYELDLTAMLEDEQETVKQQVSSTRKSGCLSSSAILSACSSLSRVTKRHGSSF
ncbi:alpha-galactosidase [Paenibacillus oralis]|uniref:alpha-galactosidase n=1 Tax=Paenibacillus oralis TaxID=2490856 RepID=UPI001FE92232|nr:alpha-galactosidase [Paenibacillus oralis]